MSEYTFKNLNEIDTVEEPADGTTMMGFENGTPIQMPMSAVKGSGGVFIIDPESSEYKAEGTAYGDKIKEALLSGKMVWCYYPLENAYTQIIAFKQVNNSGRQTLVLCPATVQYQSGSLHGLDLNTDLDGSAFTVSKK